MAKKDRAYLFTPEECPNRDHPFEHRCPLCGYQSEADRDQEWEDIMQSWPGW